MGQIVFSNDHFNELEPLLEDGMEVVLEKKEYRISKTMFIQHAVTIIGNGATVAGNKLEIGLVITSGEVTVKDLSFKGMINCIEVDSQGKEMENVVLDHLSIPLSPDMVQGVQVASTKSNGIMRNIHIQNCLFEAIEPEPDGESPEPEEGQELVCCTPCDVAAAAGKKGSTIAVNNCLLEDMFIEDNVMKGSMRLAVNAMNGFGSEFDLAGFTAGFENDVVKNLHINRNQVELCWDGSINIDASFGESKGCMMDGIEIDGNDFGFGIAGIYMYANEPIIVGKSLGGTIKNVKITNNKFKRGAEPVGEISRAIFLAAGRADFYPDTNAIDGLMEDVEICGNTIDGAGIVVDGAYCMLDAAGTLKNNVTRNINIHDNHILNADFAFIFDGAQVDGRRYDWNFGFRSQQSSMRWAEDITDDSVVTNEMIGNKIENLCCENNRIDGFRYRVVASGAQMRGHGLAKDNKVTENISFKGNVFGEGENHVKVADMLSEDYIHDGGGNEVSKEFLKRQ